MVFVLSPGGSVTFAPDGRSGRIYYSSTSRRLLDDVASLLRRFGINARIRSVTTGPHGPQFTLEVCGREDQLAFLTKIGPLPPPPVISSVSPDTGLYNNDQITSPSTSISLSGTATPGATVV